jgi:hypothetical protein
MPKVVITHAVVEIDRWSEGKAERAAAIESGSGSNVVDYVAEDGSNKIAIPADVSDPVAMQARLASPPPDVLAEWKNTESFHPFTAYIEASPSLHPRARSGRRGSSSQQ